MQDITISHAEFIRELRKPGPVWGWVNLFENDGEYVQANKTHLLEIALPMTQSRFKVVRRENGLYIN